MYIHREREERREGERERERKRKREMRYLEGPHKPQKHDRAAGWQSAAACSQTGPGVVRDGMRNTPQSCDSEARWQGTVTAGPSTQDMHGVAERTRDHAPPPTGKEDRKNRFRAGSTLRWLRTKW